MAEIDLFALRGRAWSWISKLPKPSVFSHNKNGKQDQCGGSLVSCLPKSATSMEHHHDKSVNIIGGGIFGVTAALELRRRGYDVAVFDWGEPPHPQASSTDITKMIRGDYGADEFYTDLMHEAFKGWDAWNRAFPRPLYHETGFLLLMQQPMQPGSFEMESLNVMRQRSYPVQRIDGERLRQRAPQWNAGRYPDGYYNARGGWAESGAVVAQLVQTARSEGVRFFENAGSASLIEENGRVAGLATTAGQAFRAAHTIVAAGAWTPGLVPELKDCLKVVAQPVFHLMPENPALFRGEAFPGWSADISRTGWYGFPAQPDGVVKIANHGIGVAKDPDAEMSIPAHYFSALRAFLSESLPALQDAPIVKTRLCLYCDSWDGDFYIDHHPDKPGLIVATGGSGHGFKFAPVLGPLIADVLERKQNPFAWRFQWRRRGETRFEAARGRDF
jgi:sarcosine oxidase / L-pipecolate oxidase